MTQIREDILHTYEAMDPSLKSGFKYFFGGQFGVVLFGGRGELITCKLISEDDEYWSKYSGTEFSSFWFPDLLSVVSYALQWMDKNADKDTWGWRRREKPTVNI